MNDRLNLSTARAPANLAMDGCYAVMAYFLETSSQYMELHTDACRSQMDHFFRSGFLRNVAPGKHESADEYFAFLGQSARETGKFLQQSIDLSVEYQEKLKAAFSSSSGNFQEFALSLQEAAKALAQKGQISAPEEIMEASLLSFSKAAEKLVKPRKRR